MIQGRLKVPVRRIRTDNETEFVNQTLRDYYEEVELSHETLVTHSPQQNGVVERCNHTLIEAARTMLIYAQAPLFLWAEAVATAYFTQNHSIICLRHGKTPYELLHSKLPDLSFFHVFGALCYPTNDSENLEQTMATTSEQQVVLDKDLVPSTQRLRIGRSNFRLPSDIQSKESTLQLVYDVLCRCPFFKAFLVTADMPEVYMQEFWATAYVHQRSIRFKMNNKKHIVELESFREMLHICPRIPGQAFAELPFEEEILELIRFLRYGAPIRTLTDININMLYQP
nr:putative ribonuclease H-like domain-containing protein [Tanacetum cinerariifolium]